jgi:tRNA-Thr(GGU) m(6)t(6)A37 methyltransferase TsaA
MTIQFTPIGVIENEFVECVPEGWEAMLSRIVLAEPWVPALEGLEAFSHLWVLSHLHGIQGEIELHVHPQSREDLPAVGLFATRTPRRPNPIGLTPVELVSVQGSVLTVRGLDALNGTPVLDLKPYLPRGDRIEGARTPWWIQKLWGEQPEEGQTSRPE